MTASTFFGFGWSAPEAAHAAVGDTVATSSLTKGNIIYYGNYPQTVEVPVGAPDSPTNGAIYIDANYTKYEYVDSTTDANDGWYKYEPIAWRVLENASGNLFLVAEKAIDCKCYNETKVSMTWEKSTARSWLNGYAAAQNTNGVNFSAAGTNFIGKAFNSAEQAKIATTLLTNPVNSSYPSIPSGNNTTDRIFYLKIDDSVKAEYFADINSRKFTATDYAIGMGVYTISKKATWWLRSPGSFDYSAAYVSNSGSTSYTGYDVNNTTVGVVPAFYLKTTGLVFRETDIAGEYQAAIPSTDATLSNLTVTDSTLSPEFKSNIADYTVSVPYTRDSITLTATKTDANASVIGDGEKVVNVGANEFEITVTAEDGTTKKTYTITANRAKGTGAAITTPPESSEVTDASIEVTAAAASANPGGQGFEYAKNTTNVAPSEGWQTSKKFTGLTRNTTYYIFARTAANAEYNAGTASAGVEITTLKTALTSIGAITGTAKVGETLTAGTVSPSGATVTYQWKAGDDNIGTNSTYKLTENEVGKQITVTASGTGDYTESVTSNQTAVVAVAAGAAITKAAEKDSVTATSITVTAAEASTNPGEQDIEYAINSSLMEAPTSGYQASLTFADLDVNTEYYVWARTKATEAGGYSAGVAVVSAAIKTNPVVAPPDSTFEEDEDGNIVVTLPDDGGTVIVPPGSTVEAGEDDGTVKVTTPNGDAPVTVPSGSTVTEDEEGNAAVTLPDDGGKVIVPPGSKVEVDESGDITVTLPDGETAVTIPSGTIPEGSTGEVDEDGNITVILPGDAGTVTVPPGSTVEIGTGENDGNIIVTLPDGGGTVIVPPGSTVEAGEDDGTVKVTTPNGDAPVTVPSGSTVTEDEEGNAAVTLPDDGGKVTVPPGSKVEVDEDGILVTLPNGDSVTVPSGAKVEEGDNEYEIKVTIPGVGDETVPPGAIVEVDDGEIVVTVPWASDNANLKSLTISSGQLFPAFTATQFQYTVSVPNEVDYITLTAVADDEDKATVNGAGGYNINVGSNNVFKIKVTAENRVTKKEYTITVTRAPSSNANLSGITASAGNLSPSFNAGVYTYNVYVLDSVNRIQLTPVAAEPNAVIEGETGEVDIDLGKNVFKFKVTAQDKTTTKTYTVNVIREVGNNASLGSLVISEGSLSPAFSADVLKYDVTVPYSTETISLTPTAADPKAAIGYESGEQPLKVGLNVFPVMVLAEDLVTVKLYRVNVVRKEPNAELKNLTTDTGTLTPAFDSTVTGYSIAVPFETEKITLTPTLADSNASVEGPEGEQTLNVGMNIYKFSVTSANELMSKTYTVYVVRAKSSENQNPEATDTKLKSLGISVGALVPVFNPETADYNVSVPFETDEITLSAEADEKASIYGIDGAKQLKVGSNTFPIVVTSEDFTVTQTYNVTVTRETLSANLESISVSDGELTPEFDADVTGYSVTVPYGAESITLDAKAEDSNAEVTGTGEKTDLAEGLNVFPIKVAAADGITTKIYLVSIMRVKPKTNAFLKTLTVNRGTLSPAFEYGVTKYSVDVPYAVTSIDIGAEPDNEKAEVNGIGANKSLGVGENEFTIVVSAENDYTFKIYKVTVMRASTSPLQKVQSVTIAGAPAKFAYKAIGNNTLQLSATALPANATNKTVTWKSSNPKIATVNAAGLVTFVGAEGPVTITATAADGSAKFAQVVINSVKNVTGIRTPLATVYIKKGAKNFALPVVLDDKTNKKIAVTSKLVWKSSNTKAVTVTQKGKITVAKKVKKKTTVKITVTAANGKSKGIKVIAVPKATKLKKVTAKMPKKNTLKVGKFYQLKLKLSKKTATNVKVTFKSSKPKILKVDKAGKLIGLKEGKAKITIKAGKKKFVKTIKVFANVTGIRTPLAKFYVKKGTKNFALPVALDDKTDKMSDVKSKLKWKSSNTKAVTVTQKGKISVSKNLKKRTNVTITVTAANGKSKKIKVVAVPKAAALKKVTATMPTGDAMKVGQIYQVKVKLSGALATNVKVTFTSSNKSVLKVDKAGKLVALKSGTANITVKAGGKKFARMITVKA